MLDYKSHYAPVICPAWLNATFIGMARVNAPVLLRFAINQLSSGGTQANVNDVAAQSIQYRALYACGDRHPIRDVW